jgi:hypothetical protein
MKILLLISVFLPAICFAQMHKHVPYSSLEYFGSGETYPFSGTMKLDATHTIVYSRIKYKCKICKQWYEEKTHVDTLGLDAPQLDAVNRPTGKVMTLAEFKKMKAAQAKAAKKPLKK